jgi:hypothetical protein
MLVGAARPTPDGSGEVGANTGYSLSRTMCIRLAIDWAESASFEQSYKTAEIRFDPTMASNRNTPTGCE